MSEFWLAAVGIFLIAFVVKETVTAISVPDRSGAEAAFRDGIYRALKGLVLRPWSRW